MTVGVIAYCFGETVGGRGELLELFKLPNFGFNLDIVNTS